MAIPWKREVAKFALYIYWPVFVWWAFHTDYFHQRFVLPRLKLANPEMYQKLTVDGKLLEKYKSKVYEKAFNPAKQMNLTEDNTNLNAAEDNSKV